MPDTTPEPNYQDILDKYAASLASTEAPIDPEPQTNPIPVEKTDDFPKEPLPTNPEPTIPAPEAIETPTLPETPPVMLQDVDPELKIEANSETLSNSDTQPLPDLPPVSSPNYEVKFDVPLDDETPSLTSVPKNNNFFKYLFFFSLLIFVGVLVSIVLSLVNSQKSLPLSDSNTPVVDVSPSLPPSYAFCEINDQKYAVNQSFTATDGCNTCTCNSDLTISCTEMACDASNSASMSSWKTYSNDDYEFSLNYPETWEDITDSQSISNGNREFRLKTDKMEYINGSVFDTDDTTTADQPWMKRFKLANGASLLITYTDNIGPGSNGGTKDLSVFNQILSTFKLQ